MVELKKKTRDTFVKSIFTYSIFQKFYSSLEKIIISVHVQKIDKIYDYFILQSICLIDTISGQKPKIKMLKCKYTFGSRAFSFSCKTTLRRLKITQLLSFFDLVILSEMKRRHINISSTKNYIDIKKEKLSAFSFSFAIKNTNVFSKLDEFYFKWNFPIVFTFVFSKDSETLINI